MYINSEMWFLYKETAATTSKFFYSIKKVSKAVNSNRKDLGKRLQYTGGRVTSQKLLKISN